MLINGGPEQSDFTGRNSLDELLKLVETIKLRFPVMEFLDEDVVRSRACRLWVDAYSQYR